jgi:hypothetical protein
MSLFDERALREIVAEDLRRYCGRSWRRAVGRRTMLSTCRSRRRRPVPPSRPRPSESGWLRAGSGATTPAASCASAVPSSPN